MDDPDELFQPLREAANASATRMVKAIDEACEEMLRKAREEREFVGVVVRKDGTVELDEDADFATITWERQDG